MPSKHKAIPGALYAHAAGFADELEAAQVHAADQITAAWADSYQQIRQEMDQLMAKVAQAKATGAPTSPAWLTQQARLKTLLNTTKVEMAKFAEFTSGQMTVSQKSAIAAALKHAEKLTKTALKEELPTLATGFLNIDPKNLEHLVGFLSNGSPLDELISALPAQTAGNLRQALVRGIATGKGVDWMTREATKALGLSRTRAETIVRTETLRAYRYTSRATYQANAAALEGWVWHAHLDARCCIACAVMDGTLHPLDAHLDGHPRCRCAMVPRTKSWEDITGQALPDSRPPLRSGKDWLMAQLPHIQQALMGKRKFQLWKEGKITLDDMVGRSANDAWGTMRRERSIVEINSGVNGNYMDVAARPRPVTPVLKTPNPDAVAHYSDPELFSHIELRQLIKDAEPGSQEHIDLMAGQAVQLNKLDYTVGLPEFEPEKVFAAVDKLNKAVVSKGYPSKGYSQVKAIYKAQANGVVGSKVGVVKNLTWQHKINAAKVLEIHDAELPNILTKIEKRTTAIQAEVKHGHDYVTSSVDEIAADANKISPGLHGPAVLGDVEDAIDTQKGIVDGATDGFTHAKEKAFLDGLTAGKDEYVDAADAMIEKGKVGKHWAPKPDSGDTGVATISDDGWLKITYDDPDPFGGAGTSIQWLSPKAAQTFLDKSGWISKVDPDPALVAKVKALLTDKDGFLDDASVGSFEKSLAQGSYANAIQKASWEQGLAEAKATLMPKPQLAQVMHYVQQLQQGGLDADVLKMQVLEYEGLLPQTKSNIKAALEDWEALKAAPLKPVPENVAYLTNLHESGTLTLNQLEASLVKATGQTKIDAQAAIDIIKAKGAKLPEPPSGLPAPVQADVDQMLDTLQEDIDYSPDYGEHDTLTSWQQWLDDADPNSPVQAQSIANTKAAIAQWKAKKAGKLADEFDAEPDLDTVNQYVQDMEHGYYTKAQFEADLADSSIQTQADVKAAIAKYDAAHPPTPVPGSPTGPPFTAAKLQDTNKVLGTHGARVYLDPDTGEKWLFKAPKDASDAFLSDLDEIGSTMQKWAGNKAPDTYIVTLGGKRGSIQRMFEAKDGFPGGFNPASVTKADLDAVTREHALDWLMANHDGHLEQFIRLNDGSLTAIDKGQAFRWFGQDKLDWNFHPNANYGAPPPVYNRLWKDFAEGKGDYEIDKAVLDQAIEDIQAIDDAQLRALLRPYAEKAQAQGKLLIPQRSYTGVDLSVATNDVDAFLDAVIARKNNLGKDFDALYAKAVKARQKALPDWKPTKPKATKAAAAKGKIAKWKDKPKPDPPPAPEAPDVAAAKIFDGWSEKVKAKYTAYSGKKLEASNNWPRMERVIQQHDRSAVQELFDRNYLDAELRDEALKLIDDAEAAKAKAQGAYDQAMAAHAKKMDAWKKDVKDWKDANGITQESAGMDHGVVRHGSNPDGTAWARRHFNESKYNATQKSWLKKYTGTAFDNWNKHLRVTEGLPTQYDDAYKHIDAAMKAQPLPEDVILHRGAGDSPGVGVTLFKLNGRNISVQDDLTQIVGTVQTDHGYMSTSVGNEAAFNSYDVQLKIRAPAGTPGAYVSMFSAVGQGEREIILARGMRMYVHQVYKHPQAGGYGPKWIVEVEIVPADFDPLLATPSPSAKRWNK